MTKDNNVYSYKLYRSIMGKLLVPIQAKELDLSTLKYLYESKLLYLEELRRYCFHEINTNPKTPYVITDYELILTAITSNKKYLKELIIKAISNALKKTPPPSQSS